MALENPQFPPYQDRGASKPGTSPHLPEGQVSTGIGTITRPADISPSLAEAAAEGTIATVTKTASVGGLSLGKALLIGTPLLGVVAGGVFALSQDRNPSAHPVDNTPVSDKAPEPAANQPGIVVNPEPITPNVGEIPPAPSPTPEVKTYECTMFSADFCPQVELVDFLNKKGDRVVIAGINVPKDKEEIPVFSPLSAGLRNIIGDPHSADLGDLNDLTLTTLLIEGNIKFKPDAKVKPGDPIGTLRGNGFKSKLGNREYDATIAVSAKNTETGKFYSPGEILRKLFHKAPVVKAEYNPAETSTVPPVKTNVAFEDNVPAGLALQAR